MADWNVEMPSPQGGATQTVSPVQVSPVPEFNINQVISTGANLFGDFLKNKNKADAAAAENSVIAEYSQSEDRIAQLVKTGGLSATEARSRSQTNFSKYIGSNPGLYKDLEAVRKSRMEGTATGDVYDEVKEEKARVERGRMLAESMGINIPPNSSPETVQATIDLAYEVKRKEVEWKQIVERRQEGRAQDAADQSRASFLNTLQDRKDQDTMAAGMNELIRKNFKSFSSMMDDVHSSVRASPNPEEASLEGQRSISGYMAEVEAQAVAMGGGRNQDLVQPYLKVFRDLSQVNMEMLKPGADIDRLKAKRDRIVLTSEIVLKSDPKIAALAAAVSSFPNAPVATSQTTAEATEMIARTSSALKDSPLFSLPQIVGNPATEDGALSIIKESLQTLQKDKDIFGDKAKLTQECENNVNICLRQTEAIVQQGASPKALAKIAAFYATPEFKKAVESGGIDHRALNGGIKAMATYQSAVVAGVTEEINKAAYGGGAHGLPAKIGDVVDLQFSGGKVNFIPIDKSIRSAEGVKAMRKSEEAITHLVYIGAHLTGEKDYSKYWEKNKHILMPNLYVDPADLKPGDIKGGKKFKGGIYTNPNNWEKVPSGSKQ